MLDAINSVKFDRQKSEFRHDPIAKVIAFILANVNHIQILKANLSRFKISQIPL